MKTKEELYDVIYFYIEALIKTKRITTHFYPNDLRLIIEGIVKRVLEEQPNEPKNPSEEQ